MDGQAREVAGELWDKANQWSDWEERHRRGSEPDWRSSE